MAGVGGPNMFRTVKPRSRDRRFPE